MKRVIIIGASSGIGRALAEKYIGQGDIVGITGRREELLNEIAGKAPGKVFVSVFDVADRERVPAALDALAGSMGGVDMLIYNSGYGKSSPELDVEVELHTMDVNNAGFLSCVGWAFCYFRDRGIKGHIAAVSSVASTGGLGPAPAYSATKKFIAVYMQALEQKSRTLSAGIRFTTIKPGFIDTDLIKGKRYPVTMKLDYAAERIFRALESGRRCRIIDWKWAAIVALWKLIPSWMWVRIRL